MRGLHLTVLNAVQTAVQYQSVCLVPRYSIDDIRYTHFCRLASYIFDLIPPCQIFLSDLITYFADAVYSSIKSCGIVLIDSKLWSRFATFKLDTFIKVRPFYCV